MKLIVEEKFAETQKDTFDKKITLKNDFNVLPCQGIFKLSTTWDSLTYSYCDSDYWNCPNKKCVMQLV